MNTIRIQLVEGASDETIARAHAAIDAFAGRILADATGFGPAANAAASRTLDGVAFEQAGPVSLDSEGLPWHADIHASTKTQTQKGTWTKRKGVDDATVNRVVTELRAMYPAPVAAAATVVTGPVIGTIGAIKIAPKTEYQKLVDCIATNLAAGKITQDIIDATFVQNNTSLAALATDDVSSAAYREAFEGYVASQG